MDDKNSESKKGGPYTKNDQEKRRNEVYRLHIEYGYSAVKISKMIKVNRNTVNKDIKYWNAELAAEWNISDIRSFLVKQFQRMDSLRSRLFEQLDSEKDSQKKITIVKLLYDIDNKLTHHVTKIMENKRVQFKFDKNNEIDQEKIKQIVLKLLKGKLSDNKSCHFGQNKLLEEIIALLKCDESEAVKIRGELDQLGLSMCFASQGGNFELGHYDLKKFAKMRGYIS